MVNHIVELGCPFLLLIPERRVQFLGGIIQIGFQVSKRSLFNVP
jgi:pantothenate kinase type III